MAVNTGKGTSVIKKHKSKNDNIQEKFIKSVINTNTAHINNFDLDICLVASKNQPYNCLY